MSASSPHYLLFSEARHAARQGNAWRFVLESVNSQQRLAVTDVEPHAGGERLELLAVVRGLEALDGPARVTLITKSRYVSRGLKYGMNEWRANRWQWERFGKLVPVRDHDLWQRVERALQFHQVQCRSWQFASESNQDVKALVGHEIVLSGHPPKATSGQSEPSSRTTCYPRQTKRHAGESPTVTSPGKANHQVSRRRWDSGHLSSQSKHPQVDSRSRPGRPASAKEVSTRNTPGRNKHLTRRVQGVLARLKWSLSTWLSEHRLQPLA